MIGTKETIEAEEVLKILETKFRAAQLALTILERGIREETIIGDDVPKYSWQLNNIYEESSKNLTKFDNLVFTVKQKDAAINLHAATGSLIAAGKNLVNYFVDYTVAMKMIDTFNARFSEDLFDNEDVW